MSDIVQKLRWLCHTLRHDGVVYGDYVEQLTYLLFGKMVEAEDFDLPGLLNDRGGSARARKVFQNQFEPVITLLNSAVAA